MDKMIELGFALMIQQEIAKNSKLQSESSTLRLALRMVRLFYKSKNVRVATPAETIRGRFSDYDRYSEWPVDRAIGEYSFQILAHERNNLFREDMDDALNRAKQSARLYLYASRKFPWKAHD